MSEYLEDQLRRALGREEPPPGFAARVAAAAEAAASRRASRWGRFRPRAFRWAAAACVLALAGGIALERRRECETRARGEAARHQVMLALKIAGAKLHVAQAKAVRRPLTEDDL